jgi:hypothetical protein
MWQIDHRIGGDWHYTWRKTPLMMIPDRVRKCVAFIGYEDPEKRKQLIGTAFFLSRPIGDTGYGFTYIVTAKHIIDKIRDLGCATVWLRLNDRKGKAGWSEIPLDEWKFHPYDLEVDVAFAKGELHPDLDHLSYPLNSAATEEVIKEHAIGVGEEVFLTGLFVNHSGKEKNIPIVRIGNIAAMPEEQVETEFGLIDAYLIEARSIGGLSGSPVFVHLGLLRYSEKDEKGEAELGVSRYRHGTVFLLGLMHGHYRVGKPETDTITEDGLNKEHVNMGIAIVVPITKVLEAINSPEEIKWQKKVEEEIRKKNLPVMDGE